MRRSSFLFNFSFAILLILGLVIFTPPGSVKAQCKTPSSCKTCHEVQSQYPVSNQGIWHSDHIIIDACAECHGGTRLAQDMDSAHQGMTTDLKTMASYCAACHCDDLNERFAPYAQEKGISDLSFLDNVQAQAFSAGSSPTTGFNAAAPFGPMIETPSDSDTSTTESGQKTTYNTPGNWIAAWVLLFLLVAGGGYVFVNEKRLKDNAPARTTAVQWFISRFKQETWSPYVAGIGLGLVSILAVLLANHLMTASGGIAVLASSLVNKIAPQSIEKNIYFRFVMPPALDWEVLIIIGIFIGGLLASLSSGTFKLRWNDDPTWFKVFGKARWKRFLIGFVGAMIIQYGASIAGGCTSGLAISGGMLLAPSAYLFMAGMFISGILVALLIYRKRY